MAKTRQQRGFSLIELIIVLTIISVIALVAIPLYQRYDVKVKIGVGINLIKPLRYATNDYYIDGGEWPQTTGETAGIPHSKTKPDYITSIELDRVGESNVITIIFDIPALGNNNTLIYYTKLTIGHVSWHCDRGTILNKFRPSACKK